MTRFKINVSGTFFEFDTNTLESGNTCRLNDLCKQETNDTIPFIERPAKCFEAILSYFQTGELHMPLDVCPGAFIRELDYWQVDQSEISDCCLYRLTSFLNERETRQKFKTETRAGQQASSRSRLHDMNYLKWRIWSVIDFCENTTSAKAYFAFISSMILLSIFSLALSTENSLRRPLTKCEVLEYLHHSEHADAHHVARELEHLDCSNHRLDVQDYDIMYDIFEDGTHFYDNDQELNRTITLSELKVPLRVFYFMDLILLAVFTLDLLTRLFSCPSIAQYFMSVVNIVDVLAILSSYAFLTIHNIEREHRYAHSWLHVLNYFQVFRSLRLLRVVKNVRASRVLAYSLKRNLKDIAILLLFLFFSVSTSSCIMYFVESRKTVPSIPHGWYFSIVTLTTVGYGDITPKTALGLTIASACAILGIILLAVTVPIFVNNFLILYQYDVLDAYIERTMTSHNGKPKNGEKGKNNMIFVTNR